ncbi:hypothetical protein E6H34_05500 [Candidatus Bathyarchaeota archaeon]|nr:MAG: hypothetical protein E6H34_05500 [Candidatus Bathyarchaeota archaeon]
MSPLLGAGGDRKITPGVIGSSPPRVLIDEEDWFSVVVPSHPGSAAGPKGAAVRRSKGNARWV